MTNKSRSSLYVGITNNLAHRVLQHKHKVFKGFSEKYNINTLVYYETTSDIESALSREKCIKRWKRSWKERLIETRNPNWDNLTSV